MGILSPLHVGNQLQLLPRGQSTSLVKMRSALGRVMAFRGVTIHDIVNNPIARNETLGYWKVLRQIERRSEILDFERQWNQLDQRL
jgi:hypothetical protein